MATMAQSAVQAFPSPLFPHPGLSSSAAALAPGEYEHCMKNKDIFFFYLLLYSRLKKHKTAVSFG